MEIQDAHSHFFSRTFFELLAAQAPGPGEPSEKARRAAEKARLELPDADPGRHLDRWLSELERNGVSRLVSFASLPEEAETLSGACASSGGKLVGYVLLNPLAPDALERLDNALGPQGLRGVVLFPTLHGYDMASDALKPFLGRLAERGAPCVVHTGVLKVKLRDLLGLPRLYDSRYANPLALVKPANDFPAIPFIVPHFGAGFLRETLMLGDQCDNVFVDTSSSNDWVRTQVPAPTLGQVFEATFGVFGHERVLFGTDSSTFPRGWRAHIYEQQKRCLDGLGLDEKRQALVFGGNLARLLDAV